MAGISGGDESGFRQLFFDNPAPMWVFDPQTLRFVEVNHAAVRHYGYSRDEFLAMRITDIRPPEEVARLLGSLAANQGRVQEYGLWRHRLKSGAVIDVETRAAPVEFAGRPARLVVTRDVTRQLQTEADLRTIEARFTSFVQNGPFVTYIKDTEGRYLFFNREAERVFRWSDGAHLGRTIDDLYEPADAAVVHEADREVLTTGAPVVREVRMPATTAYEWGLMIKFPIRDEAGRIVAIGGFDIDATKEKRAELALAASEAQRQATERRYRDIVDLVQEGIWLHDGGTIVFANPAAARLFGAATPEALVGRPIFSLLHPEDRERAQERTRAALHDRTPSPVAEMRVVGLDGRARIAELQGVPFEHEGRVQVISTGRDVTAQRTAEARLEQVQKMDAVGQLTGGIAHDFNNLLTVVIGGLDVDTAGLPDRVRIGIEQALRAAERGAALTHRLLAFSRRQTLVAGEVDFNRLAAGMQDLLRRTLGEQVEVELRLQAGLWAALADAGQVENALLNLAINARDAMPGGGKLTIETANAHLDEDYVVANPEVTTGDYVMLAVTDTGVGMTPEVLARAFEPFFTTKDVGKGTGLGLSMVYGFAKQSRGHARIYSEPWHGTTVRLYLPRLLAAAAAEAPPAPAVAGRPGGSETILVVEDDAQVRAFVLLQLADLGYATIAAADGPQALKIIESGQAIDLLFTDVIMPGGMTGYALAEAARRRRPALKTLFTSGYTENAAQRASKLEPGARLLAKPYRRQELAARIREALDG